MKKFPITAPDGREFRVSINEGRLYDLRWAEIKLYVPRKYFGYRCVYATEYDSKSGGAYDYSNVDYVDLAKRAVRDYYEYWRKVEERNKRRTGAAKAFEQWDGKIKLTDSV